MEDKKGLSRPVRVVLIGMSLLFIAMIGISLMRESAVHKVQNPFKAVFMPMQEGISQAGRTISETVHNVRTLREAQADNQKLRETIEQLQQQITLMEEDQFEIAGYRELFELTGKYSDYKMTGANVIAKDTGNWFHSFIIDKGTEDGLAVDMAVLAQGGLAGIITSCGPTSSRVMAIINDDSNITAMSMNSKDSCMISGDLELYEDGHLRILYVDKDSEIAEGDKIVTSNISTKYVPGLLIGYVADIDYDDNNLTKSGTIIPYVDFSHLDTVLVVTTLKDTGSDADGN